MAFRDDLRERLASYHTRWDLALFGLSLLGIMLVAHLFIQQQRNFDRGCFGFSNLQSDQVAFDCSAVVSSGAGTFLGVSNITWGFGFYLGIAALTFAVFWLNRRERVWAHGARILMLVFGLAYSSYLVYVQLVVLETVCALCLMSAVVVAALAVVQGIILTIDLESSETDMSSRLFKRDLTMYVYLAAFAVVLVGADFTYFEALTPSSKRANTTQEQNQTGAACQLDPEKEPVDNPSSLVNFQDVTRGPSDASVTVVEYFDPNCPHCKTFHETMKPLVSQYEDEVRFVFKPFPLRGSSMPEIQALYVAHQEGKFFDMLEAQYARQSRTGITEQDLQEIASEIGMNPDVLMSRIEQDKYRTQVIKQRKRAIDIGVSSTPTVLVNGAFVGSRSAECMEIYIERAMEGKLGAATSS